jgi:xylulokinase
VFVIDDLLSMAISENTMGGAMLIGIDVGTTSVKANLFDLKGTVVRSFAARYPTQRPEAGHVEQDPRDWMRLVLQALSELGNGVAVQAIGLCSQVNTHIFVDAQGEPLLPAMTWQDTRAAHQAAELDARVSQADKLDWWGAPLPIDASHPLARMRYVQLHHPDLWAKTRWTLAPKDYCLLHLTGEMAADPMTCFGFIDQKLNKIAPLIKLVEGAAERLPPIQGFTSIVGKIKSGPPCAGVPVVTGAMDAWSGLFGAGVRKDGDAVYLSGTSEILGIVSNLKSPTPGVIAFPECEGIVWHAGPTQSGGASIEWLSRLIGKTVSEISALAAQANIANTPLFLPHLEGERAPLWDPESRGAFAGMTSSTGPAELALAVMEGVAYSARLLFETLEQSACLNPTTINHSGGGSSSDIWCQIRADVLGRPIERTTARDAGVIGAALMAGVGSGAFVSLTDAARLFVRKDQTFKPDRTSAERHDRRFAAYKLLYEQLKPIRSL